MTWKLGSLFDGSGGFPLAGTLCDIEPRWASEIEPYPIAVTRSRFPHMKHLGDISKINGAEVEPVDIITFGSPCQDLSVAGKRAGLKHEVNGDEETTRSGLFMEAVRIIKEMREATNGVYPRFALWENVPGAFSSNKGEDFRIVLEELIKIVEPAATMPAVPQRGWAYADSYVGNGWSIAYRVFDAQYWGVPQRRRRIHLVADFRGTCAREILFEREGVRGYFTEGGTAWESFAAYAEGSSGAADRERNHTKPRALEPVAVATQQGGAEISENGICPIITAVAGMSGNNQPRICKPDFGEPIAFHLLQDPISSKKVIPCLSIGSDHGEACVGVCYEDVADRHILDDQGGQQISVRVDGKAPTLRAEMHGNVPCVMEAAGFCTEHSAKARGVGFQKECAPTLRAGVTPALVYSVENHPADSRVSIDESGKVQTLTGRMGTGGGNVPMIMEPVFSSGDVAGTLDASYYKGCGMRQGVEREYVAVPVAYNGENITSPLNKTNPQPGDPCHTLGTDSRNYVVIPIHDQATRFSGKRGDKSDGKGNGLGVGQVGDPMNTLTSGDRHCVAYAIDQQGGKGGANYAEDVMPTLCGDSHGTPHAVVFAMQGFGDYKESEVASGMKARDYKDATDLVTEPIVFDKEVYNSGENATGGHYIAEGGPAPTLRGTGHAPGVCVRYIVRRLTPTECARLQGFADRWGEIEEKKSFTDEEWTFWAGVRNTHAEINGKATKSYTEAQMLSWYNKLGTDSAEYKMWGNGIALPPAIYCMQGITDVLAREKK